MDEEPRRNSYSTITNQPPIQESGTKIILKQLLVVSGPWTAYFLCGLSLGSPTVFIPQIRRDASFNATIDEEMASWLASAHTYSGVLGTIILCVLARYIGRKITFIIMSLNSLAAFVTFYCSVTVQQILISEVASGLLFGCQSSLSTFILTEYTSPKYRGIFLSIKVALAFWGVWIANAVGTFFHWRKIPIIGIAFSLYMLVVALFWPESPFWLASRGRYDACSDAHRWLKSRGDDAEKELSILIKTQKDLRNDVKATDASRVNKNEIKHNFYKPILLAVLLMALYAFSGKYVYSIYAIDIIKKMTSSEEVAYNGMLALDGITVFSMYVGGGLSKIMKRRTLLLSSSSIAILLLFIISLYLYVIHVGLLTENKYVTLLLLSIFSVSVSCGPINMCTAIYGELVPLRRRSSSTVIIGMLASAILATVVKLAPLVFRTFNLHGAFLFYGVSSLICVILLYKYLPETKDKTLQEIQDCFNGKSIEREPHTEQLMRAS